MLYALPHIKAASTIRNQAKIAKQIAIGKGGTSERKASTKEKAPADSDFSMQHVQL